MPQAVTGFNQSRWEEQSARFKEKIASLESAVITEGINRELDILHHECQAGSPDFNKFQKNCKGIFTENLHGYKVSSMMTLLGEFMKACVLIALIAVVIGLLAMLQVEVLALIGLITIAAFHFKALLVIAGVVGIIGASVSTFSLFKNTADIANQDLSEFVGAVSLKVATH